MSAFDSVLFVFPDVDGFRVAIVGCVLPGPGHATRKAALLAGRAEARTRFIAALCRITVHCRVVLHHVRCAPGSRGSPHSSHLVMTMKVNIDFRTKQVGGHDGWAQVAPDGINAVEITLENGQRFQLKEIAGCLQVRGRDGYLELMPRSANEIIIREK